ncbi:MAG: BspA family leucine-rich repeat surface protein [Allomuricauda sp.]
MKYGKAWMLSLLVIGAVSCSKKDDGPANSAPVVEAKTITVDETATGQIGTVTASDPDGDDITLGISTNFEGLYVITDAGALSLAAGQSLDGKASHSITVTAFDGDLSGEGKITINVNDVNKAPVVEAQTFEVDENVAGPLKIDPGVVATDAEGDALAYELTDDANGLFDISPEGGVLSLADGQTLDYEAAASHVIIVSVSDGINTTTAELTINVIDDGLMSDDPNSFVTTWEIPSDGFNLQIGIDDQYFYDFIIDWGDGSEVETFVDIGDNPTHEYATAGTYTVAIQGDFPAILMFNNVPNSTALALKGIQQWGTIAWETMNLAFAGCANLSEYTAQDSPNLDNVTSMLGMFIDVQAFNGDIGDWDVSNVTDMSQMFSGAELFNQDISGWDVSNVIDMSFMFSGADLFNQDIGGWDISKVTDMEGMFDNSGLSPENFSNTLIGWANPPEGQTIPEGIVLGANNVDFCDNADVSAASLKLVAQYGWDLTNIGSKVQCPDN